MQLMIAAHRIGDGLRIVGQDSQDNTSITLRSCSHQSANRFRWRIIRYFAIGHSLLTVSSDFDQVARSGGCAYRLDPTQMRKIEIAQVASDPLRLRCWYS